MPGISAHKIGIPFSKKGISWQAYWTTRTPSALLLTVLSDTSIKLDWTANGVEDYDGCSVERSADGINYSEINTVTVGTETFTDTGLTVTTLYYYRVRAYKDIQYSPYSNIEGKYTYGAEIIINGSFSNQTEWSDTRPIVGGKYDTINSGFAANGLIYQGSFSFNVTAGRILHYSLTIEQVNNGSVQVYVGGVQSAALSTVGTHTGTIITTGANQFVAMNFSTGEQMIIDNFSLRSDELLPP